MKMMTIKEFIDEWNDLHCFYIKQGPTIRNQLMIKYCEKKILEAKTAYYNTEDPIMEDMVYDSIENRLRILDPNNPILEKVGAKIDE
jgi:hypothetical protein